MMLCDNIVFELQTVGGVSKYWAETISRLDKLSCDIAFLEGPRVKSNIFRNEIKLSNTILTDNGTLFRRRLCDPKIEVNIFHSSYYRISQRAHSNVVTIHDFMNEIFPSSPRDIILAKLKKRACQHAKAIVVVSEQTKMDLLKYYSFVDPSKVFVIYNGVDEVFFPEPSSSIFTVESKTLTPKGFFLYVGTRGNCKNFPYALKVLAEAHAQGLKIPLIVVGGGPLSKNEWSLSKKLGIPQDTIQQILIISNTKLRVLYSNCLALLIPSIYEGFGLPAAEAARCGALILSARGSALDEIVGETDFSFDLSRKCEPSRVLALGLESNLADLERTRMRTRSVKFNWDNSTNKLMELYENL